MRVGIDVGGTFTDLILWDPAGDRRVVHKVPTTAPDPADGIVGGLRELCELAGVAVGEVDQVIHGTTVATNLLIERTGALTGLITTEGFRDLLHIARKKRPHNFSSYLDLPWQAAPLIPRSNRMTVRERVALPSGEVIEPLDTDGVRAAARRLGERGVQSVAVCFLGSFLNPEHEQLAKQIVAEELPGAFVCASHEVAPMYREYERFNTTAVNSYVGKATARYLEALEQQLASVGIEQGLRLMTSAGGVVSSPVARRNPVQLLMSGPAGGLIAGHELGAAIGVDDVITLDVGGTSSDIGLVSDGVIHSKHLLDTRVYDQAVMVPMVEVETIGAGGGSIARVSDQGILSVGPRSAGANPGPACYGRGGTAATATDALVALGWIRPKSFLADRLSLDVDAARAAIARDVADPLGLSVPEAALGVHAVLVNNMAGGIRLVSERKGHDPRSFALVAEGGAGPLFAPAVAEIVRLPRVIVPRHPGIASAVGLLSTDLRYDFGATVWQKASRLDVGRLEESYQSLLRQAAAALDADGIPDEDRRYEWSCECRYDGQGYELRVPAPPGPIDAGWVQTVLARFHERHETTYERRFDGKDVLIVNIRVVGVGEVARLEIDTTAEPVRRDVADAAIDDAEAWFGEPGGEPRVLQTPVYGRQRLDVGMRIPGPAIIEQPDTTILVPPGTLASVVPGEAIVIAAGPEQEDDQ